MFGTPVTGGVGCDYNHIPLGDSLPNFTQCFKDVGMYDPAKEEQYLERIEQNLLPRLEKQRMQYLSPDYNPGNN